MFPSDFIHGNRPIVFEDGRQQRDFVHVRDVARAFRLAMSRLGAAGRVLNVGSGRAYAIADIARTLAEAMGVPETEPEILGRTRSGDIRHCFADTRFAQDVLGLVPAHRLDDSRDELVDWIRSETSEDRGAEMRRHLEARGLVA